MAEFSDNLNSLNGLSGLDGTSQRILQPGTYYISYLACRTAKRIVVKKDIPKWRLIRIWSNDECGTPELVTANQYRQIKSGATAVDVEPTVTGVEQPQIMTFQNALKPSPTILVGTPKVTQASTRALPTTKKASYLKWLLLGGAAVGIFAVAITGTGTGTGR